VLDSENNVARQDGGCTYVSLAKMCLPKS